MKFLKKSNIALLINLIFYKFCFSSNIFSTDSKKPYCVDWECSYKDWLLAILKNIYDIEKAKPLHVFIQDVIVYLISFVSLIAIIYIIYAWFRAIIMSGSGNEEVYKRTMKTILNVIIWITIIWLSYSIVYFIINLLSSSSTLS